MRAHAPCPCPACRAAPCRRPAASPEACSSPARPRTRRARPPCGGALRNGRRTARHTARVSARPPPSSSRPWPRRPTGITAGERRRRQQVSRARFKSARREPCTHQSARGSLRAFPAPGGKYLAASARHATSSSCGGIPSIPCGTEDRAPPRVSAPRHLCGDAAHQRDRGGTERLARRAQPLWMDKVIAPWAAR